MTINGKLSASDLHVMRFIEAHPGQVEQRTDYDNSTYYYVEGGRASRSTSVAIANLIAAKRVQVRREQRRTVGLREPRPVRALYSI